ncbi:MAG: serine/threonine protein kinase [Myxococcaceae bacterium]|nr:serine/threonine protein kinase [Myxococcaceae bacterium]
MIDGDGSTFISRTDGDDVRPVQLDGGALASSGPRYVFERVLGRGGMGEVRLCKDERVGREVALKVMGPELSNEAATARFLREARVQGQLEHPSVVPVYDLGIEAGAPFFTMKRVRGQTLLEILTLVDRDPATEKTFNRRRLLAAFSQVCLAVDFAHSRGVLHRDLKPANVMLGAFGEVHVLDWGLARVQGTDEGALGGSSAQAAGTLAGEVMGTPGYLAPEQARGDVTALSPATDVYALGAMLFELLTRESFNPGSGTTERLRLTLSGFEVRPSVRFPHREVPPELEAIIVAATALSPHERTRSARAVSDAVERYLDGDRDQQRRSAAAQVLVESATRRLELAALGSTPARAEAMREVTRALGLVPDHPAALVLLGRLLTELPTSLPPEAEAEMEQAQARARGGAARTAAVRYASWLAFVPLVWLMGVRSWPLALAELSLLGCALAVALVLRRKETLSQAASLTMLALSSGALAVLTFLAGPFVLVPALAATNTLFFASDLKAPLRPLAMAAGLAAVLVPYVLELTGLVAPSWSVSAAGITLLPRMAAFEGWPAQLVFALGSLAAVLTPTLLVGRLRDSLSAAQRQLFLQAWHVKQLSVRADQVR